MMAQALARRAGGASPVAAAHPMQLQPNTMAMPQTVSQAPIQPMQVAPSAAQQLVQPNPSMMGSFGGLPSQTQQIQPTQAQIPSMGMGGGYSISDERMKTDIKEVGRLMLPGGELPIHTFRFQGDPVRRMGFIAQHVEKVDPDAVHTHPRTGVKGVNYARVLLGAHQHAMGGRGNGNGVG